MAIVVILGAAAIWAITRRPEKPDISTFTGDDARVACEQNTRRAMGLSDAALFFDEEVDGASPQWTVAGSVQAEYPASDRVTWDCVAYLNTDGKWSLMLSWGPWSPSPSNT